MSSYKQRVASWFNRTFARSSQLDSPVTPARAQKLLDRYTEAYPRIVRWRNGDDTDEDKLFDRQKFMEAEARAKGTVNNSDNLPDEWWDSLFSTDPPLCPDCRVGRLCEGPSGGCSTNYACSHCQAEVNIFPPLRWGHRLKYGWTYHLTKGGVK